MGQEAPRPSTPTEPPPADVGRQARARTLRRIFVAALALFVLGGAFDLYGVRTRTVSASGGGYELSLTYATVSRPGLATPFTFEVRRPGGLTDGVTVAARSSYFDAFDENGFSPSPETETEDGERTIWRFAPSPADTITVSFDARIEPGVQLTRVEGRVEILSGPDGPAVATIAYSTLVMP